MTREVRTVLLVEDDDAWALLTREAFAEGAPNVDVERCSTGAAALARLRREPRPDVVVLDLNLSDMSGVDVLCSLRALPGGDGLPVVVLSASGAGTDRAAVARFGATAYREKPTTYTDLCALAGAIAAGSSL